MGCTQLPPFFCCFCVGYAPGCPVGWPASFAKPRQPLGWFPERAPPSDPPAPAPWLAAGITARRTLTLPRPQRPPAPASPDCTVWSPARRPCVGRLLPGCVCVMHLCEALDPPPLPPLGEPLLPADLSPGGRAVRAGPAAAAPTPVPPGNDAEEDAECLQAMELIGRALRPPEPVS